MHYFLDHGISGRNLILETKSTNTPENIDFGVELLREKNQNVKSIIIVTHAPHSLRAIATANKHFKDITFLSFPDDCVRPTTDSPNFISSINEIIGEVERLIDYSARGWIEPTTVPETVLTSTHYLRKHLQPHRPPQ
jgi:hypothetical protein